MRKTSRLISFSSQNLFSGLDNEEYDGILTASVPSIEDRAKYLLTDPYFLLGPVLIVRQDSTVKSLDEMENIDVGILRGASVIFDVEKYPSILFVVFDDPVKGLDALIKGTIDGVIIDVLPAYTYAHVFYQNKIKIATPPLTKRGIRLITRRDKRSEKLYSAFNQGLEKLKKMDSTTVF